MTMQTHLAQTWDKNHMPEHGLTLFGNSMSIYFYYLRKSLLFSENNRNKVPQNIHQIRMTLWTALIVVEIISHIHSEKILKKWSFNNQRVSCLGPKSFDRPFASTVQYSITQQKLPKIYRNPDFNSLQHFILFLKHYCGIKKYAGKIWKNRWCL